MTYFQNPFAEDYIGVWVLSDRQQSLNFNCPRNAGRGQDIFYAWNDGPYDLSGTDADGNTSSTLTIRIALDRDNYKNWCDVTVDVTASAVSTSAVTINEIAADLNADTQFAGWLTALATFTEGVPKLIIKKNPRFQAGVMRMYVVNGNAEATIGFNARAGVAELPLYFDRHTVASRFDFDPADNMLIALDPEDAGGASDVDDDIISNAVNAQGVSLELDPSTVQDDYELLLGRSGLFSFKNITVDGSDRITEIIEYQAGAIVGEMAKLTKFTYSGANTSPDQVTEEPHVMTSSDFVTP